MYLFHPTVKQLFWVGLLRKTDGGLILHVGAIKPLQKKRAQQDDTIKWQPVGPQTVKSRIENMINSWPKIYLNFSLI